MDNSEQPVLTLIQQLKDDSIHPSTLSKEQRLACVETLSLEGYAVAQIAQIVRRSDKTIKRDLAEIAAKNVVQPTPELLRQLVGWLMARSEAHQARLMRLARSTDGSIADRAQAEYLAFRIRNETLQRLQSLGYLPQRPQEVVGDFIHREGGDLEEASLSAIEAVIVEIKTLATERPLTPEVAAELTTLEEQLSRAKLAHQAQRLLAQQQASRSPEGADAA